MDLESGEICAEGLDEAQSNPIRASFGVGAVRGVLEAGCDVLFEAA